MMRSIAAVVAGYVSWIIPVGLIYLAVSKWAPTYVPAPGQPPALPVLLVASFVFFLMGILSACVTALAAGRRPLQHGIALAGLAMVLGLLKPLMSPGVEPLWSHLTLLFSGVVGIILGVWFSQRRMTE